MNFKFSERYGFTGDTRTIQIDGVNDALRNSFWNILLKLYEGDYDSDYWRRAAKFVAQYFLKLPVDEVPYEDYQCRKWLKGYFYKLKWYEIYDFIEFIAENHNSFMVYKRRDSTDLAETFNIILEKELSGYRFISGIISPISSQTEVSEISSAIESSAKSGLQGTSQHLQSAIELLGKKPEPDYRNSIKEAISAVESISKQLSGNDGQGLSSALDELAKTVEIHPALKSGFIKLYGYTSDENGIRHAILEQPNIGLSEAQYMIVSCSAFVNYLIVKTQSSGMKLR